MEKTLLNKNILNTTLLTASRKKLVICNYHQLAFGTILDSQKRTVKVIKDINYAVPKKLLNLPSTSQIQQIYPPWIVRQMKVMKNLKKPLLHEWTRKRCLTMCKWAHFVRYALICTTVMTSELITVYLLRSFNLLRALRMWWGVGVGHLFFCYLSAFLWTEIQRLAPLLHCKESNMTVSQKAEDTTKLAFSKNTFFKFDKICKLGFILSIKWYLNMKLSHRKILINIGTWQSLQKSNHKKGLIVLCVTSKHKSS